MLNHSLKCALTDLFQMSNSSQVTSNSKSRNYTNCTVFNIKLSIKSNLKKILCQKMAKD